MKRVWKNPSILNLGMPFESRMEKRLWKVQSRFYPGDLMTRTGDREIRSVSGRLPDNPGELARMQPMRLFLVGTLMTIGDVNDIFTKFSLVKVT